ncbi:MAG: divalent-cation tolerance protein CutA [Candidatus Omnitrophica bacterium]|nr:divalent-cation tolerance protein CutA [Candidatus Omnitrophota bacterium]
MYRIIFVTCASRREAKRIAISLIKERLVACVNIIDKVESFFWWQGKVDYAKEFLLIIKSNKKKFPKIEKKIKELHSYKVPEIITLEIVEGEKNYLRWLDESIGR